MFENTYFSFDFFLRHKNSPNVADLNLQNIHIMLPLSDLLHTSHAMTESRKGTLLDSHLCGLGLIKSIPFLIIFFLLISSTALLYNLKLYFLEYFQFLFQLLPFDKFSNFFLKNINHIRLNSSSHYEPPSLEVLF